jgi:hypothetical protein
MATYILYTKDGSKREYWCPDNGGYVYETDEQHPGDLGRMVSDHLGYTGKMMRASWRTLDTKVDEAYKRELRRIEEYEDWA